MKLLAPWACEQRAIEKLSALVSAISLAVRGWIPRCTELSSPSVWAEIGGTVTVTYAAPIDAPKKKSRTALLPLLIVLFLVSYSILTMLVVEQGRTIEAQRVLLRDMLKDSNQLAELKTKLASEQARHAQPPARTQAEAQPKEPAASKTPNTEKDAKRPGKAARSLKTVPGKPAADLEDVRRSTHVL